MTGKGRAHEIGCHHLTSGLHARCGYSQSGHHAKHGGGKERIGLAGNALAGAERIQQGESAMSDVIEPQEFTPEMQARVLQEGLNRYVARIYELSKMHPDAVTVIYEGIEDARLQLGLVSQKISVIEKKGYDTLIGAFGRGVTQKKRHEYFGDHQ